MTIAENLKTGADYLIEWANLDGVAVEGDTIRVLVNTQELKDRVLEWASARSTQDNPEDYNLNSDAKVKKFVDKLWNTLGGVDNTKPVEVSLVWQHSIYTGKDVYAPDKMTGKFNVALFDFKPGMNCSPTQHLKFFADYLSLMDKGCKIGIHTHNLLFDRGQKDYGQLMKFIAVNGDRTEVVIDGQKRNIIFIEPKDQSWRREKYNGHPSWHVWALLLWADNDQGLYNRKKTLQYQLRTMKPEDRSKAIGAFYGSILQQAWEHNEGIDLDKDDIKHLVGRFNFS